MQDIDNTTEIDRDEVGDLISSDKVKGTAVYDSAGEKIGSIHDVMISKASGQVAYAVMSFGGFLGIGEKYHPLPWDSLDYDTSIGGYSVGMAGEGFREAPSYSTDEMAGDNWSEETDDYYDSAETSGRMTRSARYAGAGADEGADGGIDWPTDRDSGRAATTTGGGAATISGGGAAASDRREPGSVY